MPAGRDDFDGKTGLLRQIERDVGDARVEVAEVRTEVDGIKSDHRELRDELRSELASVHSQLRAHGDDLRAILTWAKMAPVLVSGSVVATAAVFAYLLSKVPPEMWALLVK
jgi:hypothetical protein